MSKKEANGVTKFVGVSEVVGFTSTRFPSLVEVSVVEISVMSKLPKPAANQ